MINLRAISACGGHFATTPCRQDKHGILVKMGPPHRKQGAWASAAAVPRRVRALS